MLLLHSEMKLAFYRKEKNSFLRLFAVLVPPSPPPRIPPPEAELFFIPATHLLQPHTVPTCDKNMLVQLQKNPDKHVRVLVLKTNLSLGIHVFFCMELFSGWKVLLHKRESLL